MLLSPPGNFRSSGDAVNGFGGKASLRSRKRRSDLISDDEESNTEPPHETETPGPSTKRTKVNTRVSNGRASSGRASNGRTSNGEASSSRVSIGRTNKKHRHDNSNNNEEADEEHQEDHAIEAEEVGHVSEGLVPSKKVRKVAVRKPAEPLRRSARIAKKKEANANVTSSSAAGSVKKGRNTKKAPRGRAATNKRTRQPVERRVLPETFEVEKIMADREDGPEGKRYFVKWKGFPASENTWEPKAHFADCPDVLKDYNEEKEQQAAREGDRN